MNIPINNLFIFLLGFCILFSCKKEEDVTADKEVITEEEKEEDVQEEEEEEAKLLETDRSIMIDTALGEQIGDGDFITNNLSESYFSPFWDYLYFSFPNSNPESGEYTISNKLNDFDFPEKGKAYVTYKGSPYYSASAYYEPLLKTGSKINVENFGDSIHVTMQNVEFGSVNYYDFYEEIVISTNTTILTSVVEEEVRGTIVFDNESLELLSHKNGYHTSTYTFVDRGDSETEVELIFYSTPEEDKEYTTNWSDDLEDNDKLSIRVTQNDGQFYSSTNGSTVSIEATSEHNFKFTIDDLNFTNSNNLEKTISITGEITKQLPESF